MDIIHLFCPARTGGLERVVEMLAAAQLERGDNVRVIGVVQPGIEPPVLRSLRSCGVAVHTVNAAGRSYGAERASFEREIRRHPVGVLHTHGYRADVLHGPTAARLGFARVSTLHGFTGGGVKMRFYEWLQLRACREVERVVAVSRPIVDRLRAAGVSSDRIRLIPNAYVPSAPVASRDVARATLGMKPGGFTIGYVGRLSHEKGVDIVVRALTKLRDLPIALVSVGEGAESARLRELARTLGVDRMIQWKEPIDGVGALFGAFDAFVLGSRTEGTPIVLFEAATARVPIVATAVGGVPDAFGANEAILVPAESPDELARGIRLVFENLADASARAGRAERLVRERFAPAPWLQRYEVVYAEALAARPRRASS